MKLISIAIDGKFKEIANFISNILNLPFMVRIYDYEISKFVFVYKKIIVFNHILSTGLDQNISDRDKMYTEIKINILFELNLGEFFNS